MCRRSRAPRTAARTSAASPRRSTAWSRPSATCRGAGRRRPCRAGRRARACRVVCAVDLAVAGPLDAAAPRLPGHRVLAGRRHELDPAPAGRGRATRAGSCSPTRCSTRTRRPRSGSSAWWSTTTTCSRRPSGSRPGSRTARRSRSGASRPLLAASLDATLSEQLVAEERAIAASAAGPEGAEGLRGVRGEAARRTSARRYGSARVPGTSRRPRAGAAAARGRAPSAGPAAARPSAASCGGRAAPATRARREAARPGPCATGSADAGAQQLLVLVVLGDGGGEFALGQRGPR